MFGVQEGVGVSCGASGAHGEDRAYGADKEEYALVFFLSSGSFCPCG